MATPSDDSLKWSLKLLQAPPAPGSPSGRGRTVTVLVGLVSYFVFFCLSWLLVNYSLICFCSSKLCSPVHLSPVCLWVLFRFYFVVTCACDPVLFCFGFITNYYYTTLRCYAHYKEATRDIPLQSNVHRWTFECQIMCCKDGILLNNTQSKIYMERFGEPSHQWATSKLVTSKWADDWKILSSVSWCEVWKECLVKREACHCILIEQRIK